MDNHPDNLLLGVDCGGTFTDFVCLRQQRLVIHKVLSTPQAPEQAILQGLSDLNIKADQAFDLIHGSTVATNLVLEGRYAPCAYITNRGFTDVLSIGRQARRHLYQLCPQPQPEPIPPSLCFEVSARMDASGQRISPLHLEEVAGIAARISQSDAQVVVINLLYAWINSEDEQQIKAILQEYWRQHQCRHIEVFCSSQVLCEYREYERGIATWLNAACAPQVKSYLRRLQQHLTRARIRIMQSAADTIALDQAAEQSVRMLLSGPAGGVLGAQYMAEKAGFTRLLTFDMGGTSTDVALIDGEVKLTNQARLNHFPVAIPMLDMHTIGAGGGSIAWIDAGGNLQVGPQSAGAAPGPACYGKGGFAATVTDANVVLGRLPADSRLGGSLVLDQERARKAIAQVARQLNLDVMTTAQGIIDLANERMSEALRVMSVQKGIQPDSLCLVPFGGAGGLHVCALARSLQMKTILIPANAGVLSALGMLAAPIGADFSQTILRLLDGTKNRQQVQTFVRELAFCEQQKLLDTLARQGAIRGQIETVYAVDMRYQGQSHSLTVVIEMDQADFLSCAITDFEQLHQRRFGHSYPQPVELVTLRIACKYYPQKPHLPERDAWQGEIVDANQTLLYPSKQSVSVYQREDLPAGFSFQGPAIVREAVATSLIEAGWHVQVDSYANLIVSYQPDSQA